MTALRRRSAASAPPDAPHHQIDVLYRQLGWAAGPPRADEPTWAPRKPDARRALGALMAGAAGWALAALSVGLVLFL